MPPSNCLMMRLDHENPARKPSQMASPELIAVSTIRWVIEVNDWDPTSIAALMTRVARGS